MFVYKKQIVKAYYMIMTQESHKEAKRSRWSVASSVSRLKDKKLPKNMTLFLSRMELHKKRFWMTLVKCRLLNELNALQTKDYGGEQVLCKTVMKIYGITTLPLEK